MFKAVESNGGVEFYLIEQEAGPADQQIRPGRVVPRQLEKTQRLTSTGDQEIKTLQETTRSGVPAIVASDQVPLIS